MAKRFTDTQKWGDEWFSELDHDMMLVWLYLLDNCSHAGIWKRSLKLLRYNTGTIREQSEIESILGDRIIVFDNDKWFIPKFIKFQYSQGLNSQKPVVLSVREELNSYSLLPIINRLYGNDFIIIDKQLNNGYSTIKDKDKDKDKDNSKIVNEPRDKKFQPPTLEEVKQYFKENLYSEDAAITAWEYYDELKWHDKDNQPIKVWKLKMRTVWFKEKYKIEAPAAPVDNDAFDRMFGKIRTPLNS